MQGRLTNSNYYGLCQVDSGEGPGSGRTHFQDGSAELQIPPLRFAPVGMTKGRVVLSRKVG
jgi:hypothetical protein